MKFTSWGYIFKCHCLRITFYLLSHAMSLACREYCWLKTYLYLLNISDILSNRTWREKIETFSKNEDPNCVNAYGIKKISFGLSLGYIVDLALSMIKSVPWGKPLTSQFLHEVIAFYCIDLWALQWGSWMSTVHLPQQQRQANHFLLIFCFFS